MKIPGIIAALGLTAAAVWYNKKTADEYELPANLRPASGTTVYYYYVKKVRSATGKKRKVRCYVVHAYKNAAGEKVSPGCVKAYVKDAICASAAGCEKKRDL